jgi:MFS family permease
LSVGLLYIAPFVGGILGSAIAGKLSDLVCRGMAKRNGGVFEPEFRLFMVIPVAFATVLGIAPISSLTLGLWGFGWSAEVDDPWIAPTVFFGVIGFGCTLGSTVSVSFVVDSYRADAGSSLTSLNFCKNLLGRLL